MSKLAKGTIDPTVESRDAIVEPEDNLVLDPAPALQAYLIEVDEERSDRLLVELVCEYAQPVAKKVVASKLGAERTRLGSSRELQDAEDVCNEILVQLLRRLRRLKTSPQTETLTDFSSYVAVTAFNACNHYLRKKYPERYRLKNRLRYVLTRDERLALWERNARWICGLAEWRNEDGRVASTDRLRLIREDPDLVSRAATGLEGSQRDVSGLMHLVFGRLQSPVELDELVGELLHIAGLQEFRQPGPIGLPRPNVQVISTGEPVASEADRVEQQLYLQRLWSEIQVLPPRQRSALLLNLRDQEGRELVTLLVDARITTLGAMAEALQLSREQFAELWNKLPVDDATIARQLGLSRQQVINLRVSARRRLARKMRG